MKTISRRFLHSWYSLRRSGFVLFVLRETRSSLSSDTFYLLEFVYFVRTTSALLSVPIYVVCDFNNFYFYSFIYFNLILSLYIFLNRSINLNLPLPVFLLRVSLSDPNYHAWIFLVCAYF